MTTGKKRNLSNTEIVALAVYIAGGDKAYVDMEDVAVEANKIAPGRFAWRKYPEQINIKKIEVRLCDARKPQKGGYVIGSIRNGWMLSEKGLEFVVEHIERMRKSDFSRTPMSQKEMVYHHSEIDRMLASTAFKKVKVGRFDAITAPEADAFFRLDEYITGSARKDKMTRIINTFGNHTELGHAIKIISKKVRKL